MRRYPQPHRKMYLAWKAGRSITLTNHDLAVLFTFDNAMEAAATQMYADDPPPEYKKSILKPLLKPNPQRDGRK